MVPALLDRHDPDAVGLWCLGWHTRPADRCEPGQPHGSESRSASTSIPPCYGCWCLPLPSCGRGKAKPKRNERIRFLGLAGVLATACRHKGWDATREAPTVIVGRHWLLPACSYSAEIPIRDIWAKPNPKDATFFLGARFPRADHNHDHKLDWRPRRSSTRSRTIDWTWAVGRTNNIESILPRTPAPAAPGRIRSGRD